MRSRSCKAGEDWRFPGCYDQGGPACSGVPGVLATLDKHAAAGGVAIVTGGLGPAVGTSAVVSEWQLGKVLRVALTKHGSGYTGKVDALPDGLQEPSAGARHSVRRPAGRRLGDGQDLPDHNRLERVESGA